MASKYPMFDRSRLRILPLEQREHLVTLSDILQVGDRLPPTSTPTCGHWLMRSFPPAGAARQPSL